MGEVAERLLQQALALPADERLRLAEEIARSVDDEPEPGWDDAWRAELDRRLAEMRAGQEDEVSLAELRQRLRAMVPG